MKTTHLFAPAALLPALAFACTTADIVVQIDTVEWVDKCRASECYYLQGAATVRNNCAQAVGAQLRITARDDHDRPVRSRTFWPNSTSNFAPGETVISLDLLIDHDPRITQFELEPVAVRRWK